MSARSLHECLLIQLRLVLNPNPVSIEIIREPFEDLSQWRYSKIARVLKLPLDRIMESVEAITSPEPKLGRRFGANNSRDIVSDVFVYKMRSEYTTLAGSGGFLSLAL